MGKIQFWKNNIMLGLISLEEAQKIFNKNKNKHNFVKLDLNNKILIIE